MKSIPILIACLLGAFFGFSQRLVVCTTEKNPDNTISIFADCQITGEYTVKISFMELEGFNSTVQIISNVALATVHRGRSEVLKLSPIKSATRYAMRYKYNIYPGRPLFKSPDSSFTYLLPASAGNSLRTIKVSPLEEFFGKKPSDNFGAVDFGYKANDTICAARAGIVYDFNDGF